MNRGMLEKSLRETCPVTVAVAAALALVEALLSYVIPTFFAESAGQWLRMPFIQQILKGLLGTEVSSTMGPATLVLIPWTHPLVLALVWAHEITFTSRMPAGEIDKGSVDVLLSLPVARTGIYLCETLVWLTSGLFVIAVGVCGNLIGGGGISPELRATRVQLMILGVNLYCLYVAVGGITWFFSACCDRRGRAVALAFAFVLTSFLLSFLAQFSELAKRLSFLSVMNYYRPLYVVRDAAAPLGDLAVLVAVGIVFWSAGAWVFCRRDIRTV